MKRGSGGFTLVELVVTVACSSLVTLAVMSLLLVSTRVERTAQDTASRQSDTRIILTMLQNAAGTGGVERVETVGEDWTLLGEDGALLRYSSSEGALKTGGGAVMMDGVEDSAAGLEDRLLTISLQSEGKRYKTSVYCRTAIKSDEYSGGTELAGQASKEMDAMTAEDRLEGTQGARYDLLMILARQYGSEGEIKQPHNDGKYRYYSEWYIEGYEENPGWNKNTPWCACFLSWAAAQLSEGTLEALPHFANVNDGMERFQSGKYGGWLKPDEDDPLPGDFVFFDWDGDSDPDHVGAVMLVRDGTVYTIEGNSGGKVAVHSYSRNDACVMGYGLLKWIKLQQGL